MKLPITFPFHHLRFGKSNTPKNGNIHLSPQKINMLIQEMDNIMTNSRPYLRTGYSIKDLASELNIHSYQLSGILNQYLGKNFSNYINQYRISFSKNLIQQGGVDHLNLKGIAEKCGFNNRNSFTAAFKQNTGYTPSVFNKLQKTHQSFEMSL